MSRLELWTPDIFTDTANIFRDVLVHDVATIARDFYGISATTIRQSCGFEANSKNFLVGDMILKKLTGNVQILSSQLDVYHYLRMHGIAIPEVCANIYGEQITSVHGELWLGMEYIDGHFYSGSYDDLALMVETLPRLFALLECCPYENALFLPERPTIDGPYTSKEDFSTWGPSLNAMIVDAMPDIEALTCKICAAFSPSTHPASVVHIDLHPRNILCTSDKMYILDFDSLQRQSVEIAYNFAVYKLLRRCVGDGIVLAPYVHALFESGTITKNVLAAQAEILLRLLSILRLNSPGGICVWRDLIPVHVKGLYESIHILGDSTCAMC